MSIFGQFVARWTKFQIEEYVTPLYENLVYTRKGKTREAVNANYQRSCLFQDDTTINCGDLLTELNSSDKYFIVSKYKSTEAITGELRKVNAYSEISSLVKKFVGSSSTGYTKSIKSSNTPSYLYIVTAQSKYSDPGLLPTTTCKFLLKSNLGDSATPIAVEKADRIEYNNVAYQVDATDFIKYPNLCEVQCSLDTRQIK